MEGVNSGRHRMKCLERTFRWWALHRWEGGEATSSLLYLRRQIKLSNITSAHANKCVLYTLPSLSQEILVLQASAWHLVRCRSIHTTATQKHPSWCHTKALMPVSCKSICASDILKQPCQCRVRAPMPVLRMAETAKWSPGSPPAGQLPYQMVQPVLAWERDVRW